MNTQLAPTTTDTTSTTAPRRRTLRTVAAGAVAALTIGVATTAASAAPAAASTGSGLLTYCMTATTTFNGVTNGPGYNSVPVQLELWTGSQWASLGLWYPGNNCQTIALPSGGYWRLGANHYQPYPGMRCTGYTSYAYIQNGYHHRVNGNIHCYQSQ